MCTRMKIREGFGFRDPWGKGSLLWRDEVGHILKIHYFF